MPVFAVTGRVARFIAKTLLHLPRVGKRGSVAILFAGSAVPLLVCVAAAVNLANMIAGRAALQQAADNAALAGATAYTAYAAGDAINPVARNVATSAFCEATTSLPAGFSLVAVGGSTCGSIPGPAVSATIAGASIGTRGVISGSGCSATNTVVSGATCGFVVTVSATATANSIFSGVLGPTMSVSVSASAINPFINIAQALGSSLTGSSRYANSIWIYPLLLDATGTPAITASNPGALPDASSCSGDPTQTSCGVYSMLASTNYASCPGQTTPACTVNGTTFVGGVVQNPASGSAVITATTPLGVAFESSSGGGYSQPLATRASYGYDRPGAYYQSYQPFLAPGDLCAWPWHTVYNTVNQVYAPNGAPIYPWSLVTHWFYSSYLLSNMPPSQGLITAQQNTTINPVTGYAYRTQVVHSTPIVVLGLNVPLTCTQPPPVSDLQLYTTTYPVNGNSNCSLYIALDQSTTTPSPGYAGSCFDPANTPGQKYAAFSCQSISGHSLAFFWNDMGGGGSDDKDYGNGIFTVNCTGQPQVRLIN